MAKTIKITTDDEISIIDVDWDGYQEAINAVSIEYVHTRTTKKLFNFSHRSHNVEIVMLVDRDGELKHLPCNHFANLLCLGCVLGGTYGKGYPIVGDIILGELKNGNIDSPKNVEDLEQFLVSKFDFLKRKV